MEKVTLKGPGHMMRVLSVSCSMLMNSTNSKFDQVVPPVERKIKMSIVAAAVVAVVVALVVALLSIFFVHT